MTKRFRFEIQNCIQVEEMEKQKIKLNKIYNMDCLEGLKLLENRSIDLLYIDPPYEQQISGGGVIKDIFDYRREDLIKISKFNPLLFLDVMKPKLKIFNCYVWTSKELIDVYIKWAKNNKFNFDILIYAKNNPVPAYNNSYLSDAEYCIFIRDKGATFNNGLGYEKYKKVMFDNLNNTGMGHPTIKHLWMVKKMIEISSKENDIILDCFMGSGTTAVACQDLKRNFIGFEIESKYCDIAKERLNRSKNKITKWF